jgi:GNAT superfamily N-acetyltransferase
MPIELKEINHLKKKELNEFLQFPFDLYRNHPYWVPSLYVDEYEIFSPSQNPVLKHAELKLYLAVQDGKTCGRICGIINHRENRLYQKSKARFGWFDITDDEAVSRILLERIETWARAKGMTEIEGPMSFTNLDKAGLLIEGFDELPTLATIYNHPYYASHLERKGYTKAADWVEHELECPTELSDRFVKFNSILQEKYKLHAVSPQTKADIRRYAFKMFDLVNKTHRELHGFVAFEPEQVDLYVRKYSRILKPKFISLVANEQDELIAFGISLPSVSKALQKTKGRLFPWGWYHLWKAIRRNDRLDLYLIGTDPAWRNKGVHALIFYEITKAAIEFGIRKVESNPELESNTNVQLLWKGYEYRQHKRRRTYSRVL